MKRLVKYCNAWLEIAALCLAMALVLPHCGGGGKQGTGAAPDFRLKTLDDQEVSLSGLKGKVVLIDFWATWCGPCRESIPHLVQLQKTYQDKGFQVLGLSVDKDDPEVLRRFVKSMDISYPVAITPEEVARSYSVSGLPTTFLIDKTGSIREKYVGFSSAAASKIAARIEELVSEKP
jgi:thiol-disulfide isomerase/thioredoxin